MVYHCSFADCNATELVPILCSLCTQQLCLKHRIPEDHQCSKLISRKDHKPSIAVQKQPVDVRQPKKFKSAKSQKMAAKVALMKLKLHSNGDKGLPDSERLYFAVHALSAKSPPKPLFVSSKWTVGKAIDFMSHELKLPNTNHKASSKKLRFCSAVTGEVIAADMLLQTVVEKELLFSGSSVVIALLNDCDQYMDLS